MRQRLLYIMLHSMAHRDTYNASQLRRGHDSYTYMYTHIHIHILCVQLWIHIYIYIYTCKHMCIHISLSLYIYRYIYIQRERERSCATYYIAKAMIHAYPRMTCTISLLTSQLPDCIDLCCVAFTYSDHVTWPDLRHTA